MTNEQKAILKLAECIDEIELGISKRYEKLPRLRTRKQLIEEILNETI